MLTDAIEDAADIDGETLLVRYRERLWTIVDQEGVDEVAAETGIDRARLRGLSDTDTSLTVTEAASILALADETRDAETIRLEARDHLLLGMSSAVVDVDALASHLPGDYGPRDYQQMIEGGMAMPLGTYAQVYRYVESQNPY